MFGGIKKTSIFATRLKIGLKYWRDGRVVDCGGLENR
jgi:hypothetical protein